MQTSRDKFQAALMANPAEGAPACRRPLLSQGRGGLRERACLAVRSPRPGL